MTTGDFVRIAPNVKLGQDVKIYAFANLYGCEIGEEAIVGAGSVVTHDVPPGTIVAGNPARIVQRAKSLSENKSADFADKRRWVA